MKKKKKKGTSGNKNKLENVQTNELNSPKNVKHPEK